MVNITVRISTDSQGIDRDELFDIIDQSVGVDGLGAHTEIVIKKNAVRHEVTTLQRLQNPKWNLYSTQPHVTSGNIVASPSAGFTANWGVDDNTSYDQDENPFAVDLDDEPEMGEDVAFEDDQDVNTISGNL